MILLAFSSDMHHAFWTITIGCVCGVSCALLGSYLVLKRMSLLCDAIGHGMLPGIVLAVLVTGNLGNLSILAGAMIFGMLTAFLTQTLTSLGKVPEDAAMGVIFTTLFAVGVVLLSRFLGHVDLDPNCVFYGMFELVPLNTFELFGLEIPEAFPTMLTSLLMTLSFVALFWKELKIASFDPDLSSAMGYNAHLIHYMLVALVAASSVTAFQALGSVVVLAMFIVPAATAQLLTDRLGPMLVWAAIVAIVSSVLGYALASRWVFASNVAGMMAVVAGIQLFLAVLLAPRQGLVAKWLRNFRLSLRMAGEEILAHLYRKEEAAAPAVSLQLEDHGFGALTVRLALARLKRHRLIDVNPDGGWQLTDQGRQEATSIVRAHRLWEAYLTQNFQLPLDHLHAPASRMEHFIGPQLQKELAQQLDQPAVDPHGKSIPPSPNGTN